MMPDHVHNKIRSPMGTLGEIFAAIDQIEVKKEDLRKSFLCLQSESPSSFNFTLKWTDFDSYYTTLCSSLRHRFHLLQTLHPSSNAISQLKSFCHNSDGLGLRSFVINAPKRKSVLVQLSDAYRCAPDAPAMVLDAMEGFCNGKGHEFRLIKSGCLTMLEGLIRVNPKVTAELRDKAMKVAVQWNLERVNIRGKDKNLYALGLLLLVGAYGLIDGFRMDELIDCFISVAKRQEAFYLWQRVFPANKINDLIQKLINKNMQVAAVKYIFEFQKTHEFSPVDLLEERKLMSMRIVENIPNKGKKHENVVILREIIALKSIIRCINEYHLESEYPKDDVVALVEKLENESDRKKRPAEVAVDKKQQQSKPKKAKVNRFLEAADAAASVQNVEQPH